jgi:hypothetical protein
MALPKLDHKHSQQRSFNLTSSEARINSNYNNPISTEISNGPSTQSIIQQNDEYSFPVITANGAEVDANLSALNFTRTHSYRNNSMKMSDSTRSSKVRKRSSVETANNMERNVVPSLALSPRGSSDYFF